MSKKTFLILTILAGIIIGWPHLNFYNTLSVGDHGRDLYTFEQVFKGKLVYKDIWWVYGPLMPYVYGLFYLVFGVKISSILLAKFIITIVGGAFFYLAAAVVMPASWAFLAACFFLQSQQDFFFTFNHIGAITTMMAVLWFLLRYLYERNLNLGLYALIGCFILGLIKINFGVTALVTTVLSIALIDATFPGNKKKIITAQNKPFFLKSLFVLLGWGLIYWFLLKDLTIYEIRQCLPYFGDDQPYHRSAFETVPYYLTQHFLTFYHHWLNFQRVITSLIAPHGALGDPLVMVMFTLISTFSFLTHPIIHISTITSFVLAFKKEFADKRREFWIVQFIIWTFFVLNFHEFVSSGVWYRTFWSQPFQLFFSFFMISAAMAYSPKWLRYTVGSVFIGFYLVLSFVGIVSTNASLTTDKFLTMPRGQIYVGNEKEWVETVNQTTEFLNKTLTKDDQFFALPYDCIYYYLTGKESPTRQLIFFDHIKIKPQQEVTIIQELEAKKIQYIVMSNRIMSSETGLGIFGKTYCPLIYKYMMDNFTPLWRYGGNWQAEPGWGNNHGVIVFKRK